MRVRTSPCFNLLTQTQLGDQSTITLDVLLGQVVQQTATLTDHHLHTAAAVEVMGMHLQMGGELADTLSIMVVFPPFINYARILSRGRDGQLRAAKARGSDSVAYLGMLP